MNGHQRYAVGFVAALLLTGCASTQTITAYCPMNKKQVCSDSASQSCGGSPYHIVSRTVDDNGDGNPVMIMKAECGVVGPAQTCDDACQQGAYNVGYILGSAIGRH